MFLANLDLLIGKIGGEAFKKWDSKLSTRVMGTFLGENGRVGMGSGQQRGGGFVFRPDGAVQKRFSWFFRLDSSSASGFGGKWSARRPVPTLGAQRFFFTQRG